MKASIALDCSSAFVLPDQLFGADCAVRIAHFQQYEAQGRLRSALRRMSERKETDCLKQVFSACVAPLTSWVADSKLWPIHIVYFVGG